MKVSWNLLQKFVKPRREILAKDLAETLTMSTVEVEEVVTQAESLNKVVLGKILEINSHPNADKLHLVKVDIGGGVCEVVCGGVNLEKGMKVALAQVGARVKWHGAGDLVTLEKAKIRGLESNGMICAAEEIGLEDVNAVEHGIMDLSHLKAKVGTPLAEALGYVDTILEIDNKSVTHRPDLWGHLGLARELAAVWRVKNSEPKAPAIKPGREVNLSVKVEAKDKVVRYLAVAVTGIKVGPSPDWLVQALASLGARSINNVVDVTNYILFELGQPLHAFDLAKLASPEIIVRLSRSGEVIKTLDGVERKLGANNLLITDNKKPIALAGIMGDEVSGVSEQTTRLVFESATFDPVNIRASETELGLRTEASIRFEKSLDPNLAELALRRVVELLTEVCPSAKVASQVVDVYVKPLKPIAITLPLEWLNRRLGMDLPAKEVKDILQRLGFKISGTAKILQVMPPSWRATRDITIPEDLIEEVARIHGYGNIPLDLPKFAINPPQRDLAQELRWRIRDLLVSAGWNETLGYSFVGETGIRGIDEQMIELVNPVDRNKPYLRNFLIQSLIPQVADNSKRDESREIKMYEIGRVFGKASEIEKAQGCHLAFCLRGNSDSRTSENGLDVYRELRGIIEKILLLTKVENKAEWRNNAAGAEIFLGNDKLGMLVFDKDIDKPYTVAYCEVDLDLLSKESAVIQYQSIAPYPAIERDLTIVIPNYPADQVNWRIIQETVTKVDKLIEAVDYLGYFSPKNALTFRITFRSNERTLKSEEVDLIMNEISQRLVSKFDAVINS